MILITFLQYVFHTYMGEPHSRGGENFLTPPNEIFSVYPPPREGPPPGEFTYPHVNLPPSVWKIF